MPPGITLADLDVPQLQDGQQVTGHTSGLLVYSAVPTPIARIKKYTPILVITRQAHNPANGVRYFVVVGAIGLAIAALVAAALARRFTRPLVAAASVTRRIASGDLDATVEVSPHEIPNSPSWPTRSMPWVRTWSAPATKNVSFFCPCPTSCARRSPPSGATPTR